MVCRDLDFVVLEIGLFNLGTSIVGFPVCNLVKE